jgi:hypothetical protein
LAYKNDFYQFSFQQHLIAINGYLLQSSHNHFPTGWEIECSLDSQQWEIIDIQENVEELKHLEKRLFIHLNKEILCSHLRISFLSGSDDWGNIHFQLFEIFGKIFDQNAILQKMISIPKEIPNTSHFFFKFSKENHSGVFHFSNFSIKNRNDYFTIRSRDSLEGFQVQTLLFWNHEMWITEERFTAWFWIDFKYPWLFRPTGYCLQSGNQEYFQSWKFIGAKRNWDKSNFCQQTILDEQKNIFLLSSQYISNSFFVLSNEYFDHFDMKIFSKDFERRKFCLSSFEIFGILQKISKIY